MKKIEAANKIMTIEETLKELECIIGKLEGGEGSLEESFGFYETGIKLVKSCSEKIDKVEKQIIVLDEEDEDEPKGTA